MKTYQVEKVNSKDIKYFTITMGLLPGYDGKEEYTFEHVISLIKEFIAKELEQSTSPFPLKISRGNLVYGFKDEEENTVINESSIEIHGEIMRKHFTVIFDDDTKLLEKINEFSSYLGNELHQERIHIQFNNQKYVLQ